MTTGIRSRVPAAEYYSLPGTSISRLKEMRRSPLHYLYRLDHPKDTEPMRLGTAAHTAVLEPERFARDFAVWGEHSYGTGNLRPRRGKDWDAFKAAHSDKIIITDDELKVVLDIQAAVRGNPIAARYLETGDPEVTLEWMLGERECRGRIDWLTKLSLGGPAVDRPVVVGLKTARDVRHFVFGSTAAKLGYHLQWSWYYQGYWAITRRYPKMVEIVVESAPPHAVAVYTIPADIIDQGWEECQKLLDRLADCERTGYFPGPQEEEEDLSLPSWAYPTEDDDLIELGLVA